MLDQNKKQIDPESEACRIVILYLGPGQVDVAAPMKYKPLCYDILRDARAVIERTPSECFRPLDILSGARIVVVMSMAGRVDVAAPLPNRELCCEMLKLAKTIIERYDDTDNPIPSRGFSDKILGA